MAFNKTTFVLRMVYWCLHGNLGYDQYNRWDIRVGGECDCSSLVIWALREAGQDTGEATYTGNLSDALVARGWQRISPNGNPQPGDILLNDVHHVAVYVGNGQLAQASIDESGRASGGQSGDQANETNVKTYYDYPWNAYLRYTGGGTTSTATVVPASTSKPTPTASPVADGYWGAATTSALQQVLGTPVDGVVSSQSQAWRGQNPGLTTGWEWVSNPKGSQVIIALQRTLGVTADGLIGPGTIYALQKRMGTPQDGMLFEQSQCIIALQQRLQKGTI